MTAPPVLLEINRATWKSMFNAARSGDLAATEEFRTLWLDYEDIHCFLCDAAVPSDAVRSEPLPHKERPDLIFAAPLCADCSALPTLQRLHRVNKLLGQMWKGKNGQPMRFTFKTPWNR